MSIKHNIRKLFWKIGYDICRFAPESHPLARRRQLLTNFKIDTVLDVGANSGQFALQLINDVGYTKRIISFEPLTSAFEALKENAKSNPNWEVFNFALGEIDETRDINIAGNSISSSMLNMLPSHLQSAPQSKYIGKETITIKTLDSIFGDLCSKENKIYLKIDTQGYEIKVLKGAMKSLRNIDTVQMEMSLIPLYEGEMLFNELYNYMTAMGYSLVAIEPGFSDKKTGQLLQVDGVFHRFNND